LHSASCLPKGGSRFAPFLGVRFHNKKFLPDKKYAEHASLAHKQKGTPKYIQHVQDIEMPHGLFPDLHDVNRNKIGGIF